MSDETQLVHLVFNGEIFNFPQLRAELSSLGYQFHTSGDTEVLLALYMERGIECFSACRGQFAAAIYDKRSESLILARDHIGIKPLYYREEEGAVYAASSFKALVNTGPVSLDKTALGEYLTMRFVLPPDTLFKEIKQVEPGTVITFSKDGKLTRRFWNLPRLDERQPAPTSSQLRAALQKSVAEQLLSDVPVGVFLSGGLDSTIVATEASRFLPGLRTYSIRFSHHSDEENRYAWLAAEELRTRHEVAEITPELALQAAHEQMSELDSPSGARDSLAMYLLSRFVKEVSPEVKVIVTGTGSDELFNGYMNAYFGTLNCGINSETLHSVVSSYISRYGSVSGERLPGLEEALSGAIRSKLVEKLAGSLKPLLADGVDVDPLNFHNAFYVKTHLLGWELPLADDTASRFSLEARVPFLDPEIVELAFKIPGLAKYSDGVEKLILRDAFRNHLPGGIADRPKGPFSRQVMGFVEEHLRTSLTVPKTSSVLNLPPEFMETAHSDLWWRVVVLEQWMSNRTRCSPITTRIRIHDRRTSKQWDLGSSSGAELLMNG